ncbi:MAG: hypothetical protein V3V08_25195 [Nannocystaceae bacterium]
MKSYPEGNVKFFWLLSQNASAGPASTADAAAWDQEFMFGEQGMTLADPDQEGFRALFPMSPGTDGAMVLKVGTIISQTPNVTNPEADVEAALP